MALAGIDIFIIFLYLFGVMILGTYFSRYVKSSKDYFIAGKMLPWWAIGMSLVVSDIGALDFIAVSGQGYQYGIVVANFDWIGCLPPMILGAFIFIPFYWRAGVYTIPEYLGLRYNPAVRAIQALLWGSFLACMLGVMYWATGIMLLEFVPIPDNFLGGAVQALLSPIWGENWKIMAYIILIALIVGIYTLAGGLSAVVMTDVVQLIIMYLGGIAIIVLGLIEVGGVAGLKEKIFALGPAYQNHFKLFLPADSPSPYPWPGIIFGLALVLAPAYWLGNQAIVQRTLGSRTEWDAKAGIIWGAFLHALIPVLITFPGLIALALYPGQTSGDTAFPRLVHKLLPPGLTGLIFAAFLAALMSSVDSNLNSAATVWMRDIYQRFFVRNASDRHYLMMGRLLTLVFVFWGILFAPVVTRFSGLYIALQSFLTVIQGPNLALILLGVLWKRTTGWGGLAGLLTGLALSITMFIFQDKIFARSDPFLYIAWWSFLGSLLVTIIVSLLTKPEPEEKLLGLVFRLARNNNHLQQVLKNRVKE